MLDVHQWLAVVWFAWEIFCFGWLFHLVWGQRWVECGTPFGAGIGGCLFFVVAVVIL